MTKAKNDAIKIGPFRIAPHIRDGEATGRWVLDVPPHFSPSKKRQRHFLENKSAAMNEAKKLRRELELDGALRGQGPRLSGVTFEEVSKRWIVDDDSRVARKIKQPISAETHTYRLKNLLAHFGAMDVARIHRDDVAKFQEARIAAKRSPATVNSETRLLRQVLTWAIERELLEKLPKIEPIPEPNKHVEIPTTDEMARIVAHLPARLTLLIRFTVSTGVRFSEAVNLTSYDLRPEENRVIIRRKGDWTPKTAHSERSFPVSENLMKDLVEAARDARKEAMTNHWQNQDLIWPGRGGVVMTSYVKALASAVKEAGVKRDGKPMKIKPHIMRKTYITWQTMNGLDASFIQAMVGHAPGSSVTQKNYTHLPPEALRATVIDLPTVQAERAKRSKNA
jgi:integrase